MKREWEWRSRQDGIAAHLTLSISQWVEPALRESHGRAAEHKHIVVVAHGIFNSEFLGAIMTRRPGSQHMAWSYRGGSSINNDISNGNGILVSRRK
jgi:broad specificity phosphatase PhoE